MEQGFSALRSYARNHNLRLADVANDVVTGTLRSADLEGPSHG